MLLFCLFFTDGHFFQNKLAKCCEREKEREREKDVEGSSEKKYGCYRKNSSGYISERQTKYSASVTRKHDLISLLKASLKLPST